MAEPAKYDVVVIGSGVAGALIAFKLAPLGLRILMIEAGDAAPEDNVRATLVAAYKTSSSKSQSSPYKGLYAAQPLADDVKNPNGRNYYVEASPVADKSSSLLSYYERLVGGATRHWQGLNIRMLPNDFTMYDTFSKVAPNWPITYSDLEPWYCNAEYETGTAGNHKELDNLHGAFRSKPFPMPEIAPSYMDKQFKTALKGATFDGMDVKITSVPQARNSVAGFDGRPVCEGYGTCIPLCPSRAKYEATFHVEKAVKLGVELWVRTVVTSLTCDDDGLIDGVRFRKWASVAGAQSFEDGEVQAKIVVLAANGIETPKLLLISRQQRNSGLANSSGSVGRYLMDHPIKMSYALAGQPVYPFRGPPSTSSIESLRDGAFRATRGAFRTTLRNDGWSWPVDAPRGRDPAQPGSLLSFVEGQKLFGTRLVDAIASHASRQIVVNSAVEQLPSAGNRTYPSADPAMVDNLGIPRPVVEFQVDDYTRNAFRAAIRLHAQIFLAMGATYSNLQNNSNPDAGSGHLMGTTRMGTNRKESVVDPDLRSHDHRNLFIVGSSVFPTGATANPTLTIAALALRAAEVIGKEAATA